MAIVGFSFTKIVAEKQAPIRGQVSINNNVSLQGVEDANLSMGSDKKGIRVKFQFTSKFEPAVGILLFEGEVILLEVAKAAEEMLKRWEKEKALSQEVLTPVLNHILDRSNIQALIMARDLGLPAPIPLPKVNLQQGGKMTEKKVETPKAEEKKRSKPKKK